jgi:hypothetical protein
MLLSCCALVFPVFIGCNSQRDKSAKNGTTSEATAKTTSESIDDRDWNEAKKTDNADSYVGFLLAHPDSAHLGEARQAAKKFLTVKYTELPGVGQVLVTKGWGNLASFSFPGEKPTQSVYTTQEIEQDGTGWVFKGTDFQFRIGNATLQPRIPCASFYVYDDPRKGVELSGFEISLRGTSQTAPIFPIMPAQSNQLSSAQQSAPRDQGGYRMPKHSLTCYLR